MPTRGAKAADGCPEYLQARETGLGEKDHTANTTLMFPVWLRSHREGRGPGEAFPLLYCAAPPVLK